MSDPSERLHVDGSTGWAEKIDDTEWVVHNGNGVPIGILWQVNEAPAHYRCAPRAPAKGTGIEHHGLEAVLRHALNNFEVPAVGPGSSVLSPPSD